MIKWPCSVHDAIMFGNSALNGMLRDGIIPKCKRIFVQGEPPIPVCILWDPTYLLLPFVLVDVYPQQEWLSSAHLGD